MRVSSWVGGIVYNCHQPLRDLRAQTTKLLSLSIKMTPGNSEPYSGLERGIERGGEEHDIL